MFGLRLKNPDRRNTGDEGKRVKEGFRPGPDPPRRGPSVPASQQPPTPVHQPEGDQPTATDVTGKGRTMVGLKQTLF